MLSVVEQPNSNQDKSYASALQKRLHNSWFKVLDNRAPEVSKEIRSGNHKCGSGQYLSLIHI